MKSDRPDLEFILADEKPSSLDLVIRGFLLLAAGTVVIAALMRVFWPGL
jgi:hypothetical protein